jgi:hypothetical protein
MSEFEGSPKFESREKEPALDLKIVSLNYCSTVDEMVERIAAAKQEEEIDSVVLGEYNFKVEEVVSQLEKIKEAAQKNNASIIMAPDNQFGRDVSWGQIKKEFQEKGATTEETTMPDEHNPETIGVFVDKTGFVYAFPKTWHLPEVHKPVHKIPNTKIGVTICGEIGEIQSADLENINVLYNPSREGDDPYLKFRMLHRHGQEPLTREAVVSILMEDTFYQNLLDDSKNNPTDPDYIEEYDSRAARERKFNDAAERYLAAAADPRDSIYVKEIAEALKERNIPVVRTDGDTTGVLNQLPDAKIQDLEYRDNFVRYNLIIEK